MLSWHRFDKSEPKQVWISSLWLISSEVRGQRELEVEVGVGNVGRGSGGSDTASPLTPMFEVER